MTAPAPPPPPSGPPPQDIGNLALLAHLSAFVAFLGVPSFLGPLVVWLWKREEQPFVAEHAREALNFNLSLLLYGLLGGVVAFVLAVVTLGVGLLVIAPVAALVGLGVAIAWLVLVIIAGLEGSRGRPYRYPLTIRFVR